MSKTRACTLERLVDGFDQTLANDLDGGANGGYTYQDRPSLVGLRTRREDQIRKYRKAAMSCRHFMFLATCNPLPWFGKILLSASKIIQVLFFLNISQAWLAISSSPMLSLDRRAFGLGRHWSISTSSSRHATRWTWRTAGLSISD